MRVIAPVRASHSYTQRLQAPPQAVFPLLCPVREAEWIDGWNPPLVVSASGVAEPDCVFVTHAGPGEETWYITRHEPAAGLLEMIRIRPAVTAGRITIRLRATANGCAADITYTYTSLGPQGDDFIAAFTADHYRQFMREWETRLNHWLANGTAR